RFLHGRRRRRGRLGSVLSVVLADDLVGEVGLGGAVDDAGASLLHDEVVALVLADPLDDAGDLLQDLLEQRALLLLELLLEVVGEPGGVAPLALELLLLLAADLRRQERALLLQLLADLVELHALVVHLLLHAGLVTLERLPSGHTGRRAGQHALDVDERDPLQAIGRRRGRHGRLGLGLGLGNGRSPQRRQGDDDDAVQQTLHPTPPQNGAPTENWIAPKSSR